MRAVKVELLMKSYLKPFI